MGDPSESLHQRCVTAVTALLVPEHEPRAAQQPWQRILRHVVKAAPRDHKDLAHGIVGRGGLDPATRIRPNRRNVGREQALKPHAMLNLVHAT